MPRTFIIKLIVFLSTAAAGAFLIVSAGDYVLGYAFPSKNDYKRIYLENPVNRPYDLLLTGNSKIVNGVNPDLLDMQSFNFASQGESFPLTYIKLNFLDRNNKNKFRYVVLGLDYFSFSYSDINDDSYSRLLPPGDYPNPESTVPDLTANEKFNMWVTANFASKWNLVFMTLGRMAAGKNPVMMYLKENGQMVQRGRAVDTYDVKRKITVDSSALAYFTKILAFVKARGLITVIVFPPSTKKELANYSADERNGIGKLVDSLSNAYGVKGILNYSDSTGFAPSDFLDVAGHLNEEGADKFTAMLNRDLMNIFGRTKN